MYTFWITDLKLIIDIGIPARDLDWEGKRESNFTLNCATLLSLCFLKNVTLAEWLVQMTRVRTERAAAETLRYLVR